MMGIAKVPGTISRKGSWMAIQTMPFQVGGTMTHPTATIAVSKKIFRIPN